MTKLKSKAPSNSATTLLALILLVSVLSGCGTAFVASKQDDVLTQIDVWSTEDEYGKAISTLNYIKESHPQYKAVQIRKKSLQTQANEYEKQINKKVLKLIKEKRWAEALDLVDQAKEKYPLEDDKKRTLALTENTLLSEQKKSLLSINENISIKRSQWMINTLPVYQKKLITDPRSEPLQQKLIQLEKEAKKLSQEMTLLSKKAIDKKHYKTAKARITQAIALDSNNERKKILAQLKGRSKKSYNRKKHQKKKSQEKMRTEQQDNLLYNIEKSYNAGYFLKTRQLMSKLDDTSKSDPQLIQLKQELDRSIKHTVSQLMSEANAYYTEGEFNQAIERWEQVLMYEPENTIAQKNIHRSEKVIDKLSNLREKQNN
ncbi:MAG: hypothetical protein GY694_15240 [Gammaproteobacteria bacterium]|nr:hypothetical protein [Gammaproteobacteria bacterium]